MNRYAIPAMFLMLLTTLILSCGRPAQGPHFLLIVIDTMRADHLGCYGYEFETSPAIDRLADEGVVFTSAFSTAPWTLPAFASLLTSRYPWEHGAGNDYLSIRSDLPTLAGQFRKGGYETAAFVSHIYTSSSYRFDSDFNHFEDFGIGENYRFDEGNEPVAETVVRAAVDWMKERNRRKPLFLLVHLFDPHWEYGAPGDYRNRYVPNRESSLVGDYETISRYMPVDSLMNEDDLAELVALYDGEVRYVDSWIDSLLHGLEEGGMADSTIVLLTADHGEEFQDHRSMGHSFTFYDEVIRVPMIVRDPARKPSLFPIPTPVGIIDVYPTLLRRAGLPLPPGLRGSPLLTGETDAPRGRSFFAATSREGRYGMAVMKARLKLIWGGSGTQLFDRETDPAEQCDVIAAHKQQAAVLFNQLRNETTGSGWTVSWPAGADSLIYEGEIRAQGFLQEVLPSAPDVVSVEASGNRLFRFRAEGRAGGIRFRTSPPDSPVTFRLTINGDEDPQLVRIGRDGFHPPDGRFGIDPGNSPEGSLILPESPDHPPRTFLIQYEGAHLTGEPIDLSDDERERLRALGYISGR